MYIVSNLNYQCDFVAGLQRPSSAPQTRVSFLKGQRHQGIFSLVKGTLAGDCKFLLEYFKGAKAMTSGHGGNRLRCLREVLGLRTDSSFGVVGCRGRADSTELKLWCFCSA